MQPLRIGKLARLANVNVQTLRCSSEGPTFQTSPPPLWLP